ncbi:O-antigen ligase [Pseudomonas sp. BIGb0408]|uniref:O-antigen ligase n=1 Tax=Phytopseudomonas flavescens TaxID=29435 RepID=A0A7Y9XUA2_9GAMM|nr:MULTISPECIES: O-antigen ligase family protein [Pseudomonas]MCW2294347.1 O-antigen ligase [Pseudomonas sp. BIGb0408]NYH76379.1 O-antigen ligase [Pseudomonas flavescens]
MSVYRTVLFFVFTVFAVCFSATSIFIIFPGYGWHDQQRIGQIILCVFSLAVIFSTPRLKVSPGLVAAGGAVFFLGILSCFNSRYPVWALIEWARYLGLFGVVLLVSFFSVSFSFQRVLLLLSVCVSGLHVFNFWVSYFSAFLTGIRILDASVMFSGFANPRFFAQFQVIVIPIIGLFFAEAVRRDRFWVTALLGFMLITQWCLSFLLGGRGLWFSLFISYFSLALIGRRFIGFCAVQVGFVLLGFFAFYFLFKVIPLFYGMEPVESEVLRTGLSSRETIWLLAWELFLESPWLGVGPMHFSAFYNPIAAHPHQAILQWLCEWGVAATFILLVMFFRGVKRGFLALRCDGASPVDAALWTTLIGALVLAQVDGVFVMPYSETWMAIMAGVAVARWQKGGLSNVSLLRFFWLGGGVFAMAILTFVLLVQAPDVPRAEEKYLDKNVVGWAPRFWHQGWIPMDFDQ